MISNLEVKLVKSLKKKKKRYKKMLFVVEGVKSIKYFVSKGFVIEKIFALKNGQEFKGYPYVNVLNIIDYKDLKKISSFKSPDDGVAIFKMPESTKISINKGEWVILLDDIRDPSNLGSIIRTCDWFGIKKIFCSKGSVDKYNDKVIKSSMGSLANVDLEYIDILDLINSNKDKKTYGFFPKGQSILDISFDNDGGFLLFGNESNGISQNLLSFVGKNVTIPKFDNNNNLDSLNLSISVAITLYNLNLSR